MACLHVPAQRPLKDLLGVRWAALDGIIEGATMGTLTELRALDVACGGMVAPSLTTCVVVIHAALSVVLDDSAYSLHVMWFGQSRQAKIQPGLFHVLVVLQGQLRTRVCCAPP